MIFTPLPLKGAFEITLAPRRDSRGYFLRTYDGDLFEANGLQTDWVHENQSLTVDAGTVRGLHFQRPPHAETKLVRVAAGRVLDVIVDLRSGSGTYGQYVAIELSADNQKCLYVPRGCAHGFCSLQPNTMVLYKVDHPYVPAAEGGVLWNDPRLSIPWPATASFCSEKDGRLPLLEQVGVVEV